MENKNPVQLDELNNAEEIEEGDLYGNSENNNELNDYQYLNQNKQNRYDESEDINENNYNEENNNEEEDDRLTYTLVTLDLGDLIHIFEENNISFVDLLLLSKDDLKELQLKLYQRNRILNFSTLFNKYAKNYSISEISDFFSFNQKFIFNSSIFDRVVFPSNLNEYNENENEKEYKEKEEENNLNYDNFNNIYDNGNNKDNNEDETNRANDNEQFNLENIGYTDYINYMNNLKTNNNYNNLQQKQFFIDNNNNKNNADFIPNNYSYFPDISKKTNELNNEYQR